MASQLAYRTPAEFRRTMGNGDMERIRRFSHPHSSDNDSSEIYSPSNLNRETPAMIGLERRGRSKDVKYR